MMSSRKIKSADRDNLLSDSDAIFRMAAFQYNETLDRIMERDVYYCSPDDSVKAVADEMARRRISSVIVADSEQRPLGIVTERDMVRKVIASGEMRPMDMEISGIMTQSPRTLATDATLFDALSLLSRKMFKHVPVIEDGRIAGIVTMRQILKLRYAEPLVIIGEIEKGQTPADFRRIREQLIYLVRDKLEAKTDPADVVTMISLINGAIHKSLLKRAIEMEGPPPPVEFCFFVTGSHGRRENLLFPDQDFCVIIDDCADDKFEGYDNYFFRVSDRFSKSLNEAGFVFCPGGIMGQNSQWRKRLSDWTGFVNQTFSGRDEFTVRYLTLIFDSSFLAGNPAIFSAYMDHAFSRISGHYNVIRQMHEEEEGLHKVPLGLFNTFITEKERDHRGEIDMKRSGLLFLIEASRVLALKNNIRGTSTLKRIQSLVEKGVIHKDDSEYFENAYRVILHHTLSAQVDNYLKDGSNNYFLSPYTLSHMHQEMLKEAFKAITKLQELVAGEFGQLIL